MKTLALVAIASALTWALPSSGQTLGADCAFEGKGWPNGSYRVTGRVCQVCRDGMWLNRVSRHPGADPNCATAIPPVDGSALRFDLRYACDANSDRAFSIGAVRLAESKCQECRVGAWTDVDSQIVCQTQRVMTSDEPPPPGYSDGPQSALWLGIKVLLFIQDEAFFNVQKMIDSSTSTKQRFTDGTLASWKLFAGYQQALRSERQWDEQLARLRQWRSESPQSAAAALMEAKYWIAYAWFARGGQFSANVPDQAFKIAHERMAKARAILEDSKPYAAANPMWYVEMLDIGTFESWPKAEMLAMFDEATRADPLYDMTYQTMAGALTPRWGGTLADFHAFVRGAVAKTRSAYGNIMYARLYWVLSNTESEQDPFTVLGIPWPQMKTGFDEMMQRYPDSQWNRLNYAYFACRAGDGKTFNALLPDLPVKIPPSMPSPWQDPYTRDYCATQFAEGGKPKVRSGN